uniref:Uncharacterized protein n=1 Tax=Mycena chlorophos TaxID=658473 RepID=A0ABQ0L365_MYCCL|nr:predicted protein [Mycena chlorophos]
MLFALRLADERFVWVALKALATNEPVQVAELETSFSELRRENLLGELNEAAQTRLNDALKSLPKMIANCKLLRVVSSFPRDITETVLDASATRQMKSVAVVSLAPGRFQSKSDQRRDGELEPLASLDGPINEDSDDEEEEVVAPVDKGNKRALPPPPSSADPRPESPEETVKGKGESSEDHVTAEAAVESSPEAGDSGRTTRRRNPRRERAASGEASGPGKPPSKGKAEEI